MAKNIGMAPVYLRVKDAAAYLGIGVSTLYRRIEAGELPSGIRQSRKCVLWRRADLDAYMERCAAGMAGEASSC